MPGEERGYTSRLWAGKRTEAEVLANAREAFKGLSLRIDNVKNQRAPSTAASWGADTAALVAWRDKANVYVGNDSKMTAFDLKGIQVLLTDCKRVVLKFVTDNAASLHTQSPQAWITAMNLFVSGTYEYTKVRTGFDALVEAFTTVEGAFTYVKKLDNAKTRTQELDDWVTRIKLVFENASRDQIDLSVIDIETLREPKDSIETFLRVTKKTVPKDARLKVGEACSAYSTAWHVFGQVVASMKNPSTIAVTPEEARKRMVANLAKVKAAQTNKSLTTAQANLAVLADMRQLLGR